MALACVFSLRSPSRIGKHHGFTLLGIIVCLVALAARDWLLFWRFAA